MWLPSQGVSIAHTRMPSIPLRHFPPPPMQIIFASRTHSQLSQFVDELHRPLPTMSLVALGSRKVRDLLHEILDLCETCYTRFQTFLPGAQLSVVLGWAWQAAVRRRRRLARCGPEGQLRAQHAVLIPLSAFVTHLGPCTPARLHCLGQPSSAALI